MRGRLRRSPHVLVALLLLSTNAVTLTLSMWLLRKQDERIIQLFAWRRQAAQCQWVSGSYCVYPQPETY